MTAAGTLYLDVFVTFGYHSTQLNCETLYTFCGVLAVCRKCVWQLCYVNNWATMPSFSCLFNKSCLDGFLFSTRQYIISDVFHCEKFCKKRYEL